MAITKNDLTNFYNDPYFVEGSQTLLLKEKQNSGKDKQSDSNKEDSLSSVTLIFPGNYLFINASFLSDSKEIYKIAKKEPSFRGNHDGTLLLEHNGTPYIIYIEMKSGYKGVLKKAIYQLPVSSIKMKSYLRNLASYTSGQYQEIGLIISLPPKPEDKYDTSSNEAVLNHKMGLMPHPLSIEQKYHQAFTKNRKADMQATDFRHLSQTALHPDIRFHSMPVFHCPVPQNGAQINIESYLTL